MSYILTQKGNEEQSNTKILFTTVRMVIIKKRNQKNSGKDAVKLESYKDNIVYCFTFDGSVN